MKYEAKLEIGDVVFLNSDQNRFHPMTVEDMDICECGIETVDVVYHGEQGIMRDSFPMDCLSVIIEE